MGLHTEMFEIGQHGAAHYNLPPFYDLALLPMPDATDFDATGFVLTYKGMVVDYGTGTYADFLLSPKPVAMYKLAIETHSRAEYNEVLRFTFTVEGRYLSFWTTSMLSQFVPTGYGPEVFPTMTSLDTIGGIGEGGESRNYFYALNWGQAEEWNETEKLILIYTHGYKRCYWCKPSGVEATDDFRVLKVNLEHALPEIALTDIDVITDGIYVRLNTDDVKFDSVTSTIFEVGFEVVEDISNYYNPWTQAPKIYPEDE